MKTLKDMPKDYQQLLHLDDIKSWNMYRMVKRIVELQGFYSCMYEDVKTVVIA